MFCLIFVDMSSRPKNIFYADDDPDDQEIFQNVLEDIGSDCEIYFQSNGAELVRALENPPPFPQLVFLDLNMPAKNGYQVLKEIRDNDQIKQTKIVVFSTANDEEAIERTRDLGATLYLPKPGSYALLKKAISTILSIDWSSYKPAEKDFVFKA